MISVIIPLYNKERTIKRSIQSVLNQTYTDYEIIVVDDGSTDHSVAQIPEDKHIRIIHQENQGVSAARNKGIHEAVGDFVTFLDADDEWKPAFLSTMNRLATIFPSCSVFASSYERCDNQGSIYPIRLNKMPFLGKEGILSNYFEVAAYSDPPICSISVLMNKSAIQSIGGFPVSIYQGEDLLTWAKLAINYRIAYCVDSLAIFHNPDYSACEKPKRIPSQDDYVGNQLEQLFHENSSVIGLKQYIGSWHKMRASIFLRLPNQRTICKQEIRKAQHWGFTKHLQYYSLLLLLPFSIRIKLITKAVSHD